MTSMETGSTPFVVVVDVAAVAGENRSKAQPGGGRSVGGRKRDEVQPSETPAPQKKEAEHPDDDAEVTGTELSGAFGSA